MVKIISVISKYTGCGQTTVVVNLATGLAHQGYRILIGDLGHNEKLDNWLGISQKQDPFIIPPDTTDNFRPKILHSPLGIDLVKLVLKPGISSESLVGFTALEKLDYDFLLLLPGHNEDCQNLAIFSDAVIACTDLSHVNESEELQALEEHLHGSAGKANSITLILPNKIETKEWEHNSQQLFALGDFFGYEKIADPIPT